MKFIGTLIIFIFISCSGRKPRDGKQILQFGLFTIETPQKWKKIKAQGADSYVGRIAIDGHDTLDFDLGWYSNTLTEDEPQIIERSMLKFMSKIDTTEFIIVDNRKHIDPDKYKKNNISWDTIDGRRSKIVFPRQSGVGTTGIYIDSIWQSGSGNDRFNLYGINLNPVNEKQLLQAIKTLRFHKSD